jgi:predicted phosphate transport protein (TIGR00153 family)
MPRDERFVERLSRHSNLVVEGAAEFRRLLSGGDFKRHAGELVRLEEAADEVTRETVQAIHRSFITPFDRAQILALITALDDTIDLMKEGAQRICLYGVAFTPEMLGMGDCVVRATTEIRDAIPLLGSIARNRAGLARMQIKVRAAESEADALLDRGLRSLYEGEGSPGHKLTVERVYELIESVADRCEDVADVIAGIVVEQV